MRTVNYIVLKSVLDEVEENCGPLGVDEYLNVEIPKEIFKNDEYFEVEDVEESNNGYYIIKYLVE